MTNPISTRIELPDGRIITLETGKLAKQAAGSVTLRMGDTFLLATVTAAKEATPGTDFMPLQVEYREKFRAFSGWIHEARRKAFGFRDIDQPAD